MISRSKLYQAFEQYGESCILGSYAIASKYYTEIPFLNFFKDYCRHFGIRTEEEDFAKYFSEHRITRGLNQTQRLSRWISLTELNKYEIAYDIHFHPKVQEVQLRRSISGLQLMKEIHDESRQNSFKSSRNSFRLIHINPIKSERDKVCQYIEHKESLLIVSSKGEGGGWHITVFGFDKNGFYTIETTGDQIGAKEIKSIAPLRKREALLTIKIP